MYRIRDNNFGTPALARFDHRSFGTNETNYPNVHEAFPQVSTDDLDEWYFICATFNPNIIELDYSDTPSTLRQNTQYWLNHILPTENGDTVVANSNLGAKCKVEIISRSDLLRARGFKVDDLTVDAEPNVTEQSAEEQGIPPNMSFNKNEIDWIPKSIDNFNPIVEESFNL